MANNPPSDKQAIEDRIGEIRAKIKTGKVTPQEAKELTLLTSQLHSEQKPVDLQRILTEIDALDKKISRLNTIMQVQLKALKALADDDKAAAKKILSEDIPL